MPAHVFNVPQAYQPPPSKDERSSRSKFRWIGDAFRRSRSRSSSADGRRHQNDYMERHSDPDPYRTSPPKPEDYRTITPSTSRHRQPTAYTKQASSTDSEEDPLDNDQSYEDRLSSLSTSSSTSSSFSKFTFFSKTLNLTSPRSSFTKSSSTLTKLPVPLSAGPHPDIDDDYDSLASDRDPTIDDHYLDHADNNNADSEDDDADFDKAFHKPTKALHHVTSPESYNNLRSSIASTASTAALSDYSSPTSRSSSTSTHTDDQINSPRIEYEARTLLADMMQSSNPQDDVKWTDFEHAMNHFASMQWRIVKVESDGNCLFRAISDQIYKNDAFHTDIRRRIVDYIDCHRDIFQPFVENERLSRFEPIEDYCGRMKSDTQWGGNPELYAAARLFNVEVVVHQGPSRQLRITNDATDEPPTMELHLLFCNDHYDSLHDDTRVDDTARLSITANLAALDDEAQSTRKIKKTKSVFFLGEETRVERVDIEEETVPVRPLHKAVLRRGKLMSVHDSNKHTEPTNNQQEVQADDDSSLRNSFASDNQQDEEPVPVPPRPPVESDVRFGQATRISFRKGRRVHQ